ncbi:putative ABC transporter permease [Clostridium sp. Marseille-P299]|uniref:putative ABC transporter permease n=1 Tax=Clostridium sp. Marseille-P299 TaxID=1805477 RepID=UPI00082B602C|nr:putative ABC transporter permease [Clostridium sp. Marseille-P299]
MGKTILGLEVFDIFYNFFIYSFFGWIYESLYVSFCKKTWINRGFLNGPVIPIYGFGATFFYIIFFNTHTVTLTQSVTPRNVVLLYFIGMISATVLEFVTSWVMEKLFHAKWWDYSDRKFNIQGRISLIPSLFWGFLSVVMAYLIQPAVTKFTDKIPRNVGDIVLFALMIVFLSDLTVTVIATLQLNHKLQVMEKLREELYEYAMGLKWYEKREEIKGKISNPHVREFLNEFRESLDKSYERFQEKQKQLSLQMSEKKQLFVEVEDKIKEFKTAYKKQTNNKLQRNIYKRLFKAFPNMKVSHHEGAFADLKERLKDRKNK